MRIRTFISKRRFREWRSWQLVYEWEDIFCKEMRVSLTPNFDNGFIFRFGKIYGLLPISKFWRFKPAFVFEMLPEERYTSHNNSPYVVPCIIDWYSKTPEELNNFFQKYSKHKLIIVTSKQAYCYLSSINTPIPFGHLPLSLSDKYRITSDTKFEKDIDVVLMGRQNPVLLEWLKQYNITHPDITIASSKREKDNYNYRLQDGTIVANATSREQCMDLMKRSKVSLYSTKAMDDDYTDFKTNGFNQVTPRIFECLATGNHVIARYKENEDTDYFELNSICPHTDSYESFEKQMDFALTHPVNMKFYSEYLEKHYTSTRVKMLEELVKSI